MRRVFLVLAPLFAAFAMPALAASQTTWMAVMLDGRKVGSVTSTRATDGNTVTTTQTMDVRITRGKAPLDSHSETIATEGSDGSPQAFEGTTRSAAQETSVSGKRQPDGNFARTTVVGGASRMDILAWPAAAVLTEGQRLAFVSHGFAPGSSYPMRAFDPIKQQVASLTIHVVGDEMVDLPGGTERLHHLRQTLDASKAGTPVDIWVNDHGDVRRGVSPLLGFRMEVAACDEACAKAPVQDIDVLRSAMVMSPRMMPNGIDQEPLIYQMSVDGDLAEPFATTDEQRVRKLGGNNYEVIISNPRQHEDEPGPTPEDTLANPWVQSDAPEVISLAREVVGSAATDLQRAARIRSFLTGYIYNTGLDVGYASALETIQSRHGDCTEHAVLFAALARSLGIPTRIVTGLVYVQRYAGATRVFVPHTWVQSWINGRWISYDSAESRFGSTHIALGVGSGDPWRFFAATASLGRIHLNKITPGNEIPGMYNNHRQDWPSQPPPSPSPITQPQTPPPSTPPAQTRH